MSKKQLLELPPNLTPTQLQALLNERIRDLDLIIKTLASNPSDEDFAMGNFLIHNLADPVADLDAVNLRTLKRFSGTTPSPALSPTGIVPGSYVIGGSRIAVNLFGQIISIAGSAQSSPVPLVPSGPGAGTTPPPPTVSPSGPPTVTTLPSLAEPGQQVIFNGILWQFVGATQFAGIPGFWEPVVSTPPALQDTWANRANYPAANYAIGTLILYTDRTVVYRSDGATWKFWSGAMAGPLANLPSDLGVDDSGFHYQATDYKHLYLWSGSAWGFDPNDAGSGWLVVSGPGFFIADGLYGLCDGSTYSVAQSDGSTSNVTPAVAANTYIRR